VREVVIAGNGIQGWYLVLQLTLLAVNPLLWLDVDGNWRDEAFQIFCATWTELHRFQYFCDELRKRVSMAEMENP
jgi:hypothetical protein